MSEFEAKQLPRLAIARPPAGPAITVMGTINKITMDYRIGNVVPSIVPMYSPRNSQMPGDVYKPLSRASSRLTPRPLGLIPERREQLPSRIMFYKPSKFKQGNDKGVDKGNQCDTAKPNTAVPTTRLKPLSSQYRAKSALTLGENIQSSITNPSTLYEETDPDYMDMLGKLDVPLTTLLPQSSSEYIPDTDSYTDSRDNINGYQKQRHSVCLPIKSTRKPPVIAHSRRAHSLRVSSCIINH